MWYTTHIYYSIPPKKISVIDITHEKYMPDPIILP